MLGVVCRSEQPKQCNRVIVCVEVYSCPRLHRSSSFNSQPCRRRLRSRQQPSRNCCWDVSMGAGEGTALVPDCRMT